MSSVAQHLLTAEEFWRLPENGKPRELVRGEVIETMPPGGRHSTIAGELMRLLGNWVVETAGGYAGVEGGFVLARNPDILRAPDIYYVRADRIPSDGVPEAFWTIVPDLAIEVISPSET